MKNLLDTVDERHIFQSTAFLDVTVRRVKDPQEVILLLHGHNERGRRIYRKLIPFLPENALILAPNAPFPLPRFKEDRLDFGYTWYFYDKFKKDYVINQDLARDWLRATLKQYNPTSLPLKVIGFSQGGYLSPLVGLDDPNTQLVIGIGCEFRSGLLPQNCPFPLIGIHGTDDTVVSIEHARNEIEKLKLRNQRCEWFEVSHTEHLINQKIGLIVKATLEKYGKISS